MMLENKHEHLDHNGTIGCIVAKSKWNIAKFVTIGFTCLNGTWYWNSSPSTHLELFSVVINSDTTTQLES